MCILIYANCSYPVRNLIKISNRFLDIENLPVTLLAVINP